MPIIVIVGALIAWAFIAAHNRDNGIAPRSRGSLRYQRRKARRFGIDAADVEISPRGPSYDDPDTITGSHVGDLKRGLTGGCMGIVAGIVWACICAANDIGDWILPGWLAIVLATWFIDKATR